MKKTTNQSNANIQTSDSCSTISFEITLISTFYSPVLINYLQTNNVYPLTVTPSFAKDPVVTCEDLKSFVNIIEDRYILAPKLSPGMELHTLSTLSIIYISKFQIKSGLSSNS